MSSKIIMIILIVILIVIYLMNFNLMEDFNLTPIYTDSYKNVDYNLKNQDCNELTASSEKCIISTVNPSTVNICQETEIETETSITSNCKEEKKLKKKSLNKLESNSELLSNFKNDKDLTSQQNSIISNTNNCKEETKLKKKSLSESESKSELLSNLNNDNDKNSQRNSIISNTNDLISQQNSIMSTTNDLIIDIKSLNSLENDLLTNY